MCCHEFGVEKPGKALVSLRIIYVRKEEAGVENKEVSIIKVTYVHHFQQVTVHVNSCCKAISTVPAKGIKLTWISVAPFVNSLE